MSTPDEVFTPYAVSGNGQVVAGNYWVSEGYQLPALWTASGGVAALGEVAASAPMGTVFDLSYSGDTAVGYMSTLSFGGQAFRWTAATGMVAIDGTGVPGEEGSWTPWVANGVSANGNTVVGDANSGYPTDPFQWTSSTDATPLFGTSNGTAVSAAAISADGTTIAGWSEASGSVQSFRWSSETGMVTLNVPRYADASRAQGISADGTTIVGQMFMWEGTEAFLWTEEGAMVSLGELAGGRHSASAQAVSGDGRFVVGTSAGQSRLGDFEDEGNYAFLWDATNGMRNLEEVLKYDYGLTELAGWKLEAALDISDDGSVIVGIGRNPSGEAVGWMVVIPEPSVAALSALGMGLICFRKRGSGRRRG